MAKRKWRGFEVSQISEWKECWNILPKRKGNERSVALASCNKLELQQLKAIWNGIHVHAIRQMDIGSRTAFGTVSNLTETADNPPFLSDPPAGAPAPCGLP